MNKFKFQPCCKMMARVGNDPEACISYFSRIALFGLSAFNKAYRSSEPEKLILAGDTALKFCVWCGQALPDGLRLNDEWIEAVKKICPEINIFDEEELIARVPVRYLTGEWLDSFYKVLPKSQKSQNSLQYFKAQLKKEVIPEKKAYWLQKIKATEELFIGSSKVCCSQLAYLIYPESPCSKHQKINFICSELPIQYQFFNRAFYLVSVPSMLRLHKFYEKSGSCYRLILSQIFYCPWCGKALPKSLAREWFEIVTKEFGVTDIFNRKQLEQKLPPKFLTEEWWRERGL